MSVNRVASPSHAQATAPHVVELGNVANSTQYAAIPKTAQQHFKGEEWLLCCQNQEKQDSRKWAF